MTKIATINNIAKKVVSSVNKNQKLPTIEDYTKQEYGYLLCSSVIKPGKDITKKSVKPSPKAEGDSISRTIYQADYTKLAKYFVKFVDDNKRLPNYIQFKSYKIRPSLFIFACAKIVKFYAENKKMPTYCNFNSKVFSKPSTLTTNEFYDYFVKVFGKVSTIDEAFSKVKERGYAYYYDDKYSNKTSVDRIKSKWGVNCTDSCQLFWHIGKALGYDVRCIHVKCSGGDGHVRLQFKHNKHTGGNWINRDPAAILSANGQPLTYIWCSSGTKLAVNPSWFLENLNR